METITVRMSITREGKKELTFDVTFKMDEDDQLKAVNIKQLRAQLQQTVTE